MAVELENEEIPRYLRVYNYYKDLILSGTMAAGTKLPSIRKGSAQLQMSRTTMETAYMLLAAEGYIASRPQSGYYVTDIAQRQSGRTGALGAQKKREETRIEYDFVTQGVDRESFRFELWRRYMKSALRQDERLLSYGEPQGEQEFREVLGGYLQEMRSVICTPDQIVIGAGVQTLLQILCPLLKERGKIAFHNPEFLQGRAVFEDYGFEMADNYREEGTGMYYISPSQMAKWEGVMPIADRLNLVGEASERKLLLIEDDYNSEFRYFQRPTPSLQGLAGGRGVVYLGTFSKMLLPSIRMSFMVLPPELLGEYEKRKNNYNQTASKAEQIAITQFIRDGHLAGQIRKSRKIHLAKAAELARAARNVFGERVQTRIEEAGFHVMLSFQTEKSSREIAGKARSAGVAVIPVPEAAPGVQETGEATVMLVCANVASQDYEAAMEQLRRCI
ncbi:PLP-dependent aminotransferase family protein [Roseburia hominis]